MPLSVAKVLQFQVYNDSLFVLDAEGTLWKNPYLNDTGKWIAGWIPIQGPSKAEHHKEEERIRETYKL